MNKNIHRTLLLSLFGMLVCILPVAAQHQVVSYVELGTRTPVSNMHYGVAGEVDMRLSPLVGLRGGLRLTDQYPSGLGDIKVGATVFFRPDSERWSCENVVQYSNYAPYPMSQLYYRLLFAWESKYVRIDVGNAFAFLIGSGIVKTNLLRPSFSVQGSVREKTSPWNVTLFIRNFNRFESHGSRCMEWGSRFSATVWQNMNLFCEPYVVTAGNFNGTATFYNFNCLLGIAYTW